jgi:uncharacterized protein YsxB (DUF464 family)
LLKILIQLDTEKVLGLVRASGHAGDVAKGSNIICAAATSLMRSACRTVISDPKIKTDFKAAEPGNLEFSILSYDSVKIEWLRGITDYLLTGLIDLDNEYPEFFEINIIEKK